MSDIDSGITRRALEKLADSLNAAIEPFRLSADATISQLMDSPVAQDLKGVLEDIQERLTNDAPVTQNELENILYTLNNALPTEAKQIQISIQEMIQKIRGDTAPVTTVGDDKAEISPEPELQPPDSTTDLDSKSQVMKMTESDIKSETNTAAANMLSELSDHEEITNTENHLTSPLYETIRPLYLETPLQSQTSSSSNSFDKRRAVRAGNGNIAIDPDSFRQMANDVEWLMDSIDQQEHVSFLRESRKPYRVDDDNRLLLTKQFDAWKKKTDDSR